MSYVATIRYVEDHDEGSRILGIYSTEEEAVEILRLYKRNAHFEILEIQHIEKNLEPKDLLKIKPFKTQTGGNFVKVNDEEYASQGDYFASNNIGSKTCFSEIVNK